MVDENVTKELKCKFYSDFVFEENPTTFDEAVKIYQDLPKKEKKPAPKIVTLFPLSKLDNKAYRIQKQVQLSLISQTEYLIDAFNDILADVSDLLQDSVYKVFTDTHYQLSLFQVLVQNKKGSLLRDIGEIIPDIREGKKDHDELVSIFTKNHNSPFSIRDLKKWLEGKTQEARILSEFIHLLNHPKIHLSKDVDTMLVKHNAVLCLEFNVTDKNDEQIEKMKLYSPGYLSESYRESYRKTPWYKNHQAIFAIKQAVIRFKDFVVINTDKQNDRDCQFLVNGDGQKFTGNVTVKLFIDGVEKEFECPTKPQNVTIEENTSENSFLIKWTPPEYGADNVLYYSVAYCENDEHWSEEITENKDDTEITIKCISIKSYKVQAFSLAGFSEYSDIMSTDGTNAVVTEEFKKQSARVSCRSSTEIYRLKEGSDNFCVDTSKPDHKKLTESDYHLIITIGTMDSNKRQWLNGLANYILGVIWEHSFRFQLIPEEDDLQHIAGENSISSYTFHYDKNNPDNNNGFRVSKTLVVVNIQDFGHMWPDQDDIVMNQFSTFLKSLPDEFNLHAVCLCVNGRKPPSEYQKFLLHSLLSMFGRDVAGNLLLICNMSPLGADPEVVETLSELVLFQKFLCFNNSTLYDRNATNSHKFWEMNHSSYEYLFSILNHEARQISLALTKEVVQKVCDMKELVSAIALLVREGNDVYQEYKERKQQSSSLMLQVSILSRKFWYLRHQLEGKEQSVLKHYKTLYNQVMTEMEKLQCLTGSLHYQALKPNPLLDSNELESIIEAEKEAHQIGSVNRIQFLENLKTEAAIIAKGKVVLPDL